MKIIFIAFSILSLGQEAWTPSVQTPGAQQARIEDIQKAVKSSFTKEKTQKSNLLSANENEPTNISESSVEDKENVVRRFMIISDELNKSGVASYIKLNVQKFLPEICSVVGDRPVGVPRLVDKLLNGISILAICGNATVEIQVMDYSFQLEQQIITKLPSNFYNIDGGYMSTSIGKTDKGRYRRHSTVLGQGTSISILMQGDYPDQGAFLSESAEIGKLFLSKNVILRR